MATNKITKIIGKDLHQKIAGLWEQNDSTIVRTFGHYFHDKSKVIVITDDIENSKKYIGNDLFSALWLCDSQEYASCDCCGLISPINETILEDGELFCQKCR